MRTFDPAVLHHSEIHRLLVGGVAPRPIALVSSMDAAGRVNLSPFSFFNVFGVNPAVVCFSPAFSGKTGAPKNTMENLDETRECTISIVTHEMVHQISLASAPYARGVDEFEKSGLTKRASERVTPPGVAESPFIMEAKLLQHVDFGRTPGSANMMICEIMLIHVREDVFNDAGGIDPHRIDQVARMGGAWYTRANQGLFSLAQPSQPLSGVDSLPEEIRLSPILTGRHLAQLASLPALPHFSPEGSSVESRHRHAAKHLDAGDIEMAWQALTSR